MGIHRKCSQNAMATIRPSVLTAFSHLEDQAEISIINQGKIGLGNQAHVKRPLM